jgi:hypothetical protein
MAICSSFYRRNGRFGYLPTIRHILAITLVIKG